jgi:hypothetical protein
MCSQTDTLLHFRFPSSAAGWRRTPHSLIRVPEYRAVGIAARHVPFYAHS